MGLFGPEKTAKGPKAAGDDTRLSAFSEDFETKIEEGAGVEDTSKQLHIPPETQRQHSIEAADVKTKMSIISEGTVIDGNVSCEHDLVVGGVVKGDIVAKGYLRLENAKVGGNVYCEHLMMNGGSIDGAVEAHVFAEIGGCVTGSIDSNKVEVKKDACVQGDITTGSITIAQGASIESRISTKRKTNAAGQEKSAAKPEQKPAAKPDTAGKPNGVK